MILSIKGNECLEPWHGLEVVVTKENWIDQVLTKTLCPAKRSTHSCFQRHYLQVTGVGHCTTRLAWEGESAGCFRLSFFNGALREQWNHLGRSLENTYDLLEKLPHKYTGICGSNWGVVFLDQGVDPSTRVSHHCKSEEGSKYPKSLLVG